MQCPFCDPATIVMGNDLWCALEDRYPVSEGHLLVVPRRHVTDICELDAEELGAMVPFIVDCVAEVRSATGCDGVNIGVNLGRAAGQTVPHLHVHVIPRNRGDVEEPKGGVRGVIPSKRGYDSPL